MDSVNINRQCLEKIMCHLTKLICISEFENIKELEKLVTMATSVSAHIYVLNEGIQEEEEIYEENDGNDDDDDEFGEARFCERI